MSLSLIPSSFAVTADIAWLLLKHGRATGSRQRLDQHIDGTSSVGE